jgi:hypothetical protein
MAARREAREWQEPRCPRGRKYGRPVRESAGHVHEPAGQPQDRGLPLMRLAMTASSSALMMGSLPGASVSSVFMPSFSIGNLACQWKLAASAGDVNQYARIKWPGRAFEPCGLPDLPGDDFIWPNHAAMARHGTTTWTLHPGTLRRCHPANSGKARYSPNENRCCYCGSPAHCCCGWQSGRSTLDC